MEFNKEIFEKALKANKIVRYQQHFEAVVKSYLEIENEALRIHDVVGRSEQLLLDDCPNKDSIEPCRNGGICHKCS